MKHLVLAQEFIELLLRNLFIAMDVGLLPQFLDLISILLDAKLDHLNDSFLLLKIEPIILLGQLFRKIFNIALAHVFLKEVLQVHAVLVDGVEL